MSNRKLSAFIIIASMMYHWGHCGLAHAESGGNIIGRTIDERGGQIILGNFGGDWRTDLIKYEPSSGLAHLHIADSRLVHPLKAQYYWSPTWNTMRSTILPVAGISFGVKSIAMDSLWQHKGLLNIDITLTIVAALFCADAAQSPIWTT